MSHRANYLLKGPFLDIGRHQYLLLVIELQQILIQSLASLVAGETVGLYLLYATSEESRIRAVAILSN
jgi:hypothetical protein